MSVAQRDGRALTPELLDLMEHEKVIEQCIQAALDVGHALRVIKDGKKYRAAGYSTFDAYLQERWGITHRHADRLMRATEIAELLPESGPMGPLSERQLRPLAPLRHDPEKVRQAWDDAVRRARDDDREEPTGRDVAEAVAALTEPKNDVDPEPNDEPAEERPVPAPAPERKPLSKPDLGGGVSHPARFGDRLLDHFAELLTSPLGMGVTRILDPFAGTGRIHDLGDRLGITTVGIELEPEWADMHERTICGSALDLAACGIEEGAFDAIVTSPTYGNRLADSHDARDASLRRSYTHDLGRKLHADNSGAMQWGPQYRAFHEDAWHEAVWALRDGGLFVLNIKDHIRDGREENVAGWHVTYLVQIEGLAFVRVRTVDTGALRQGENADARLPEQVFVFRKEVADE